MSAFFLKYFIQGAFKTLFLKLKQQGQTGTSSKASLIKMAGNCSGYKTCLGRGIDLNDIQVERFLKGIQT